MSLEIIMLESCRKEVKKFPEGVIEDYLDAVARLKKGVFLSLPLSRPMPSIGSGVHELRLKDRSGIYRIVYVIIKSNAIYVVHAFKKTTQETPSKNIDVAKSRIKGII